MWTSVMSGACSQRSRNSSKASLLTMACWPAALCSSKRKASSCGLALFRRQLQDLQIAPITAPRRHFLQQVIDFTELAGRKQMLAIPVAGKGAWLAHQPINDVAVIDAVIGAPA